MRVRPAKTRRIQKYPRHPEDIEDIEDIFCKSLKLLDFLNSTNEDIPEDIFGDEDKSPLAPSCATNEVFPKRKRFVNPELSSMAIPPFAEKNIDSLGYAC